MLLLSHFGYTIIMKLFACFSRNQTITQRKLIYKQLTTKDNLYILRLMITDKSFTTKCRQKLAEAIVEQERQSPNE